MLQASCRIGGGQGAPRATGRSHAAAGAAPRPPPAAAASAAAAAPAQHRRIVRSVIVPRASAAGSHGDKQQQQQQQQPRQPDAAAAPAPATLDLPFESAAASTSQQQQQQPAAPPQPRAAPLGGLRRAPLSGGVKTATARYDLPAPSVAVRNLVEQAQFAHLCTIMSHMHHRRAGYPFGTLVDFAPDGAGMPLFCLSPLAIHARNLIEDPRCSLVVQMPGWTGLANARVTIFGDVYQLPPDMQAAARDVFLAKQASKERWVLGNFVFFRMHRIRDIYFVGGFGTVQWIDVADYLAAAPDRVATDAPQRTLAALNEQFAGELARALDPAAPADDAALISIDALGADVRVRRGGDFSVERLGFGRRVEAADEAGAAMAAAIQRQLGKRQ